MQAILLPIIPLIIANVAVTIRLVRSDSYRARQKILQGVIIWAVPILGLLWIGYMLREDSFVQVKPNPLANRDESPAFDLHSGGPTEHR